MAAPPAPAYLARDMRLTLLLLPLALSACSERFSADAYNMRAVQQANRVEQGTVAGVRRVQIVAGGEIGAATGAAAGGTLGGAAGTNRVGTALGAVGGALVGGLVGTATERVAANTDGYEYIVRKANNELVSVAQRDARPIPIGTRVLVIAGSQARIVPDYTVPAEVPSAPLAARAEPDPPAAAPPAVLERSVLEALIPAAPPMVPRLPGP